MDFKDLYNVALNRRTAKQYNPELNIDKDDLNKLYEFIKTAPHSMGLELIRVLNFSRDYEKRDEIISFFKDNNKEKAMMSSDIAIIISKKQNFFEESNDNFRNSVKRVVKAGAELRGEEFVDGMENNMMQIILQGDHANNNNNKEEWSSRQAYIILGYFMIGAAALGINSTAMEGFQSELTNYLQENNIISNDERVTLVTLLGYTEGVERAFIGKQQFRKSINDFVKFY